MRANALLIKLICPDIAAAGAAPGCRRPMKTQDDAVSYHDGLHCGSRNHTGSASPELVAQKVVVDWSLQRQFRVRHAAVLDSIAVQD
ncbi:MAG: hypothetical protein QOE48_756 [Mycobacterium sp.]|nr:hypothetical protein [Mycobacterium sp.]